MVALLFDMDGVIYRGNQPIAEAISFVQSIQHLPHIFVTNNSAKSPAAVQAKLAKLGITTSTDRILTSAHTTAAHIASLKPGGFRFFAVGGPGVSEALVEAGGVFDSEEAEFVVVGEGPGLDYASLTTGINLLLAGKATLIGTNPDITVDAGDGKVVPGAGALLAPFQVAAKIAEVPCLGKPHPAMFLTACKRLNVTPGECVMFGDRPDTDIKGAAALGMRTVLVLTGRHQKGDAYPPDVPAPSRIVASLSEIDMSWLTA